MDNQHQSITFKVKGMSCPSCPHHVKDALLSLPGVETVVIDNWRSGETHVQAIPGTVAPEQIKNVLQEIGYIAVI